MGEAVRFALTTDQISLEQFGKVISILLGDML
jgi:hypothetical protein